MSQINVRRTQKLCVCGRSKAFPICDSTHENEGWTCAAAESWSKMGFCASYRYENLARKLASHYQAALILPGEPMQVVDTLVTIVDGTDLELPLAVQSEVQARHRLVVTLGVPSGLLQPVFADSQIIDLERDTVFGAFNRICSYLDGGTQVNSTDATPVLALQSAFISHAVEDEPLVAPVVDYLRDYFGADLFVCADSVSPGVNWHDTILAGLHAKQIFVFLLSEATLASHYCSFEIGVAYALEKTMRVLSLDGSPPPAFLQHIQAVDLPRIAHQKPWLDHADILMDELIRGLAND